MPEADPSAAATEAIVLESVTKRFDAVVAVDAVSFEIREGEFFSMLGPSGCGKTTTLRMIAGFEEPTSGRILLRGGDVTHVPPAKRHVNMVFQSYALFPHMSVFENVAFGLRVKRVSRDDVRTRVASALRSVRLEGMEERKPGQLSGGQQQRVALARALVNEPAALLLDEPLGALDLKLRQEMQLELKEIQSRTRTTFVYVTHDQEEALTMSDRIAVMNGGLVEQIAAPRELYEHPASPFVAGFIGTSNLLALRVDSADAGLVAMNLGEGERLLARSDARSGETVQITVRPEKIKLGEPAAEGGQARVHGTVAEAVYLGSMTQVIVDLPTGERLVVHRLNDRLDGDEVQAGDRIVLHWAAEHSFVIPATPALAGSGTTTGGEHRMSEPIRLSRRGFLGATMAATRGPRRHRPRGPRRRRAPRRRRSSCTTGPYYQKDFTGFKAYFQKYGVPKYITFNTDQAELARAASGAITFDLTHPCIAYTQDWAGAGLIGEIDTKKFTAWKNVNKELAAPGMVDGKPYLVPWDWGYSTPMYRGDKYVPSAQSWEAVLFDKKLRNKVTMYDEGVAIIKIGALINGHHERQHADAEADQPVARHDDQGEGQHRLLLAVRDAGDAGLHLGQGVGHLRLAGHLRAGRREAVDEERQGRLHAAQGGHAGLDLRVRRSPPSRRTRTSPTRTSTRPTPTPAMDYLVNAFYTGGSAMTPAILAKTPKKFVKQFNLDTLDTALKPPKVWLEEHLENRNAYLKAYTQVKSA